MLYLFQESLGVYASPLHPGRRKPEGNTPGMGSGRARKIALCGGIKEETNMKQNWSVLGGILSVLLLAVLLVYLAAGGTSMLVLAAVTGLLHCSLCGSLLYHLYRIKA